MADNVRFIVKYDDAPWAALDDLDQWDTPEKYAEAPVMVPMGGGDARRALNWEEYRNSYGNKDNYTVYTVLKEVRCDCCGNWGVVDAVGGCSEYHGPYSEPYPDGTNGLEYGGPYTYGELPEWVRDFFTDTPECDL